MKSQVSFLYNLHFEIFTTKFVKKLYKAVYFLETLDSDPFDNDAPILGCRAIESSLWELKALSNHWYVRVSDRSKFIFGNRPEQRTALTSDETWKAMERKFNEDNSVLGKPLVGGRLKILEDLISD